MYYHLLLYIGAGVGGLAIATYVVSYIEPYKLLKYWSWTARIFKFCLLDFGILKIFGRPYLGNGANDIDQGARATFAKFGEKILMKEQPQY